MLIDLRVTPEGRSQIEQDVTLEKFKSDLPPFADAVKCKAVIDRIGGTIAADLRFAGVFEIECARCLEPYGERVEGGVQVLIKEREQGRAAGSYEGDDDDGVFYYDAAHEVVDVSSAIYDEIMTSLPLKPLCSESCEGVAGFAVGEGGAGEAADPRWAELAKLKK